MGGNSEDMHVLKWTTDIKGSSKESMNMKCKNHMELSGCFEVGEVL